MVGRDTPESLYDRKLAESGRQKISLLFGGIGDCRNVYRTFMQTFQDRMQGKLKGQSFQFTLVDIMPAVIARGLVIFLLLDDMSKVIKKSRSERSLLLQCLYYTYLSPIIPGQLATILQARIQRAIDILEDKKPSPAYLDIPHIHRPEVLRVLQEWQHDASARLPVSKMRRTIISQRLSERVKWDIHHSTSMGPKPETAPEWQME